jgi:hypothetical protein
MLIKLSVGKSTLAHESSLDVSLLVVHDGDEFCIVATESQAFQGGELLGVGGELIYSGEERGSVEGAGGVGTSNSAVDGVEKLGVVELNLRTEVGDVEGKDRVVGDVVEKKCQKLWEGGWLGRTSFKGSVNECL